MNNPNPRTHLFLSFLKSLCRIGFCTGAIVSHIMEVALVGLIIAELIGILEEIF